jgi:hypothetical protein
MAAGRLSCFARNGRSPGEESRPAPLRHRRSRRSRPAARLAHQRGRMERSIRQRGSRRTWRLHRATEGAGGVGAGRSSRVEATGRIDAPDKQGQACDQRAAYEGVEVRRAGQSRDRTLAATNGLSAIRRSFTAKLPTGEEEIAGGVISSLPVAGTASGARPALAGATGRGQRRQPREGGDADHNGSDQRIVYQFEFRLLTVRQAGFGPAENEADALERARTAR